MIRDILAMSICIALLLAACTGDGRQNLQSNHYGNGSVINNANEPQHLPSSDPEPVYDVGGSSTIADATCGQIAYEVSGGAKSSIAAVVASTRAHEGNAIDMDAKSYRFFVLCPNGQIKTFLYQEPERTK